jgi:ribonucleoside-diphosphate reductase alpha chain
MKFKIKIDNSRDSNLTAFGKATLKDRYLLKGEDGETTENYQQLFERVATTYADNQEHAQRLYDYISNLWFMPSTPILSNGGTDRGLPISCFLNETSDSLHGIASLWFENVFLASRGGGIGSYWGNVRAIGEEVKGRGKSSGLVPFIKVTDSQTLAISQGSLRRGSAAAYLDMSHPEIEEFIDLRRPTGGDPNRRSLNIHQGVCITDKFMEAVEKNKKWDLISPATKKVMETVQARDLWIKLLTSRVETGEPYILFTDTVNRLKPEIQKHLGLNIKTSNLCSEITLPTGIDYNNKERTAVCCLSSYNLEYYDEFKNNYQFFYDTLSFLDNVLQDFIDNAPLAIKDYPKAMDRAIYSAKMERSVGMGVMGFHSFLQGKNVPIESAMSKVWNNQIFKNIKDNIDKASRELSELKEPCEDAKKAGVKERLTNKMAIAPTASISIICGGSSPGIEPYSANSFTQKTLTGSFNVRNKHLKKLLIEKGKDIDAVWSSITVNEGSVQHLDFLNEHEKLLFKTAREINQQWLIDLSADRTPYICQAQSLNLFLPGDVSKKELHNLHFSAWKKGLKSLYYCRSTSLGRADKVSEKTTIDKLNVNNKIEYDECLACQ